MGTHKFHKDGLNEGILGIEDFDEDETEFTKGWLQWCKTKKHVKVTESPVPDGILPPGFTGILIDVKVQGKGPDDKIYASDAELRQKVARGNCVLQLQKKGVPQVRYVFFVFALKKFSGGMGDEDDSPTLQNMWQNYFVKSADQAVKVICTKKANGEAAHVSSRRLFNQNYFCVGSKNVHMLVRNKADIEEYKDSRYMVAGVVAKTVFDQIVDNPDKNPDKNPDNVQKFIQFMQTEKCTMVNEILQPNYQHVENLSYLKSPKMLFIAWCSPSMIKSSTTLIPTPPNNAIDQVAELGLETIDYEVITADLAEDYMTKIRKEFGYEGRVLYFVDAGNHVIGLIKKKTSWYIILRAIREKTCSFCSKNNNFSMHERHSKIAKRLRDIQGWIGFSDEYRESWTKLGNSFVDWVFRKKLVPGHWTDGGIRSHFPIHWKSFIDENPEMQKIYDHLEHNFS